jgi:hypothetical protein
MRIRETVAARLTENAGRNGPSTVYEVVDLSISRRCGHNPQGA